MISAKELRQLYLDFFKSKEHSIINSASLIPNNDPTVLFTTAGMHPLVPYLMGEIHPEGKRIVDVQKCVRTDDIDEVGDKTHHTFFEMLGNWSLGDYFKKEAIEWSWEFLTDKKWLGLEKKLLAVSVFEGDSDAPFDQEAYDKWITLGISPERIAKLPKKQNWWGPAGKTGPCGPDSEMFYWVGDPNAVPTSFHDDNQNWVEIWNDVFMEFNKQEDGSYVPLSQQNVDTGMGLERTSAVINGLDDNYLTDLFSGIINKIRLLSDKNYGDNAEDTISMRIIADHLRAATFIIGDENGVTPSNSDQGYIVRRLIRRAIRHGRKLGIQSENWTKEIAKVVVHDYSKAYPELRENVDYITANMEEEEQKFKKTLERGLKKFEEICANCKESNEINGESAFDLYQTYGFPIEITKELAAEKNYTVNEEIYLNELMKHQNLSRTASAGMFKGGLADAGEESKQYHTTTHLLHKALRMVLGDHVSQKGSNITAQRLRFDFNHTDKLSEEEKQKVEKIVNDAIKEAYPVTCEEMVVDEAKKLGAVGVFDSKYGEKVKVYTIGDKNKPFSREICGGPHVENTKELGIFSIIKEQSSSSGVRRIKAVLK